jgi:hypothetical protein
MGDVVTLVKPAGPFLNGRAKCLICQHEWQAVVPVGTAWLECQKCGNAQGVMRGSVGGNPAEDEMEWTCNCGCDVFKIVAHKDGRFKGVLCMRCGAHQGF